MKSGLTNKKILITGCCGTIGRELLKQLVESYEPEEVIGIDNNETGLFFVEQEFINTNRTKFYLADVRDSEKITRVMENADIVFHTAALKHVILCERSPFEAIQTNIMGVKNIINAANKNDVETVIFTSSDKAVNPTNVMGTSKLMGEKIMTSANANLKKGKTVFASTRFGNVLGSRGSVIPIFKEQIKKGGPVTLTDPEMTRFIMSIKEAVKLVIDSAGLVSGGEVFITKMPVIRIKDLAEVMIQELAEKYGYKAENIKIKIIGTKPGEKMYEELMNTEETRRAIELVNYFAVTPAFKSLYRDIEYNYDNVVSETVSNPYNSAVETYLNKQQIKDFLYENRLLEGVDITKHPDERYWP
jgi:FlaA1/EpsC-like NDP-sugar epimerase